MFLCWNEPTAPNSAFSQLKIGKAILEKVFVLEFSLNADR